jgi:hypothetical protein
MGFRKDLERAKRFLGPGGPESHEQFLCSILCGKIMERSLKELLKTHLPEATPEEESKVRKEFARLKKPNLDSLSAGELVTLLENCNLSLRSFANKRGISIEDIRPPDLKTMVRIRNEAIHGSSLDADSEADAHLMYGSVWRLVKIADRIRNQSKEVTLSGPARMPERRDVTPAPSLKASVRMLSLYRNKESRKYFVYLDDEDSGKVLLILPTGQIKVLEKRHFEEAIEVEEMEAKNKKLILSIQAERYHEYKDPDERGKQKTVTTADDKEPTDGGASKGQDDKLVALPRQVYTYEVNGAIANLIHKSGSFVILKDSTAVEKEKASIYKSHKRIRRDLLRKGILVVEQGRGLLRFTEDVSFGSASAASGVISATSTDGLICFKLPDGKTLKETLR